MVHAGDRAARPHAHATLRPGASAPAPTPSVDRGTAAFASPAPLASTRTWGLALHGPGLPSHCFVPALALSQFPPPEEISPASPPSLHNLVSKEPPLEKCQQCAKATATRTLLERERESMRRVGAPCPPRRSLEALRCQHRPLPGRAAHPRLRPASVDGVRRSAVCTSLAGARAASGRRARVSVALGMAGSGTP